MEACGTAAALECHESSARNDYISTQSIDHTLPPNHRMPILRHPCSASPFPAHPPPASEWATLHRAPMTSSAGDGGHILGDHGRTRFGSGSALPLAVDDDTIATAAVEGSGHNTPSSIRGSSSGIGSSPWPGTGICQTQYHSVPSLSKQPPPAIPLIVQSPELCHPRCWACLSPP